MATSKVTDLHVGIVGAGEHIPGVQLRDSYLTCHRHGWPCLRPGSSEEGLHQHRCLRVRVRPRLRRRRDPATTEHGTHPTKTGLLGRDREGILQDLQHEYQT